MQTVFRSIAAHVRRLAHDGSALLSLFILGAIGISLLALWPALAPINAAPPPAPPTSLLRERADEQRWIAERIAALNSARAAARERQEEAKEEWLARHGLSGGAP